MPDNATIWSRIVDGIVRGEGHHSSYVRICHTPKLLKDYGLAPVDLVISAGKIARVRREHPEVSLKIWHLLPNLLREPMAIFPSARRDGSIVVVLIIADVDGNPVIVPVVGGHDGGPNTVLTIYGKLAGLDWVSSEIAHARREGLAVYVGKDFTATLPQPGSAEAIPSSPGPIPADGTVKPRRLILTLSKNTTKI